MNIQLNIPTAWDQLPPTTLKKIAWYFYKGKTGKELDVLIYFALLNIRWWQFKKMINALRMLRQVTITTLKTYYSFLYKQIDLTKFIKKLKVNGITLVAPADRLQSISIEEFAICEDLHFEFLQTNDLDYLIYLTAVLYRKTVQGEAVPFNKNTLTKNAKLLEKINKKTLLAIALSYKGSSLYIQSLYPYVFKKLPVTAKTTKAQKPTPPGLGKIIIQLAGGKFGNLKETKQTNVHDFLAELNNQLKPTL